jgi:MFS family permease
MNFGYANGVFNSFFVDFEFIFSIETYEDRKFWSSFITAICSTGAAIGAFTIGSFIKWGKRNCLHLANAIMIASCLMMQIKILYVIAVGRFFQGYAVGCLSVLVPSFINEIVPIELKGPLGSATQFFITFGTFYGNCLGVPLPDNNDQKVGKIEHSYLTDHYWRILFEMPVIISIIQSSLLICMFNYETPKFLK